MSYVKYCFGLMLLLVVLGSYGAEDRYPFADQKQSVEFSQLLHELRCLVCQNQDLADSNAPLALDLKKEIYSLVKQGQSRQQVLDYMTGRYGDFVLYNPPFNATTYILWVLPFALLIIGLLGLGFMIHKRYKQDEI